MVSSNLEFDPMNCIELHDCIELSLYGLVYFCWSLKICFFCWIASFWVCIWSFAFCLVCFLMKSGVRCSQPGSKMLNRSGGGYPNHSQITRSPVSAFHFDGSHTQKYLFGSWLIWEPLPGNSGTTPEWFEGHSRVIRGSLPSDSETTPEVIRGITPRVIRGSLPSDSKVCCRTWLWINVLNLGIFLCSYPSVECRRYLLRMFRITDKYCCLIFLIVIKWRFTIS